jgi:penicillin-binding protein 1C
LRADTWFIPGKSPIRLSTLHRTMAIDTRTGLPACASTDPKHVRIETFEYWPSDLAHLFAQAGMPRRPPPAETCDTAPAGAPPAITSPLRATTYTQRAGAAPLVIALNATAEADTRSLHWFANEAYVGASQPGTALGWQPRPGRYVLRVVDDRGRSDARDVRIEVVE